MFGDLSNLGETNVILSFITAALVVELVFLFIFRETRLPLAGKRINEWYDVYKVDAILLDTLSVVIGFILSAIVYSWMFAEWNIVYFLVVMLGVQIAHDFLFWKYVIVPLPEGKNQIIDTMKQYAKDVKGGAILGDSLMYILGVPIAGILLSYANSMPNKGISFLLAISIVCLYPILYFLYTKPLIATESFLSRKNRVQFML